MTTQPHFLVDKKGLAKLLERRGKAFILHELLQNAWDENTTRVDVTAEWLGDRTVRVTVVDDKPEGFADLTHAYTLFAESAKKTDPTKRGRFNLGEKLVIADAGFGEGTEFRDALVERGCPYLVGIPGNHLGWPPGSLFT